MNPEENKKTERVPIKSLRTFQGDVQEAISKNNFSSTTILVKEQERKLENPVLAKESAEMLGSSNARNKTFIIFGVGLIVLGLVSVAVLYYMKSTEKVIVEKQTKAIIAFTEEKTISLTNTNRKEILQKIIDARDKTNLPVNSVLFVNPTQNEKIVSISDLLSAMAPNMSPSLSRSFGKEYMVGIFSFDENVPFIILTVDDYSLSYPGMLKWEETMESDLGELFNINLSTSSPKLFIDEVIKNRDIRSLKDSSGNSVLLYSFVDRKTLVITKNENSLSAIVGKLIISKQVK
jgi:hypothetical protein